MADINDFDQENEVGSLIDAAMFSPDPDIMLMNDINDFDTQDGENLVDADTFPGASAIGSGKVLSFTGEQTFNVTWYKRFSGDFDFIRVDAGPPSTLALGIPTQLMEFHNVSVVNGMLILREQDIYAGSGSFNNLEDNQVVWITAFKNMGGNKFKIAIGPITVSLAT